MTSIPISKFNLFKDKKPTDGQAVIYFSKEKKSVVLGYFFESFNMVICNDKKRFNIVDSDKWIPYSYVGNLNMEV